VKVAIPSLFHVAALEAHERIREAPAGNIDLNLLQHLDVKPEPVLRLAEPEHFDDPPVERDDALLANQLHELGHNSSRFGDVARTESISAANSEFPNFSSLLGYMAPLGPAVQSISVPARGHPRAGAHDGRT
jgi:hypothetical protein